MLPTFRPQLPLIARASSPKYPDRIAVLFLDDAVYTTWTFESAAARDVEIDRLVSKGVAEKVHVHCGYPGCGCTFPTMLMVEDRDGNLVPRPPEERPPCVRRTQKAARRPMRGVTRRR